MCLAGEDAKVTGVSPDQLETQPVDLETLVPPSEPSRTWTSPDHSASEKRTVFQSKGNNLNAEKKPDSSKPDSPDSDPKPIPMKETKKEEDFTESDQAGGCGLDLNILTCVFVPHVCTPIFRDLFAD